MEITIHIGPAGLAAALMPPAVQLPGDPLRITGVACRCTLSLALLPISTYPRQRVGQ